MKDNKWTLFFISIALVLLLCSTPYYGTFITSRMIFLNLPSFTHQLQHLDPEERKEIRFGLSYRVFRDMAKDFDEKKLKNIIFLLPPTDYVHKMHFEDIDIPEPSEFYYFTSINAVNQNSPNARNANWVLEVIPNDVSIKKIRSKQHLDSLLELYKPYNN